MKKVTIILLLLIVSLTACGFNKDVISIEGKVLDKSSQYVYSKDKKKILYQQYNKNNGGIPTYEYIPLDKVEMESFSILSGDASFAKDKNILYCKGRELTGSIDLNSVDIKSFDPEGVGKDIHKVLIDKDNVYYFNSKCEYDNNKTNFEIVKMSSLNPNTISFLTSKIIKDDNQYFHLCGEKSGSELPLSYENFDESLVVASKTTWMRDENTLGYFNSSCDFVAVSTDTAETQSFENIKGTSFYKSNTVVYYETAKIDIVNNPSNFQLFNMDYKIFKDNTQYYYFKHNEKDKLIIIDSQFDAETFQETSEKTFFKDKSNYYYNGDIMNEIDYQSFEIINSNFSKDKNTFYYKNGKVSAIIQDFDNELNPHVCSYNIIETNDNYYRIISRGNEDEINIEKISKLDKKEKSIGYFQDKCNE